MAEIPHDPYQTLQMRLANQYGGAAANAVIAPMANAMNDAGMRKMADMMRSAAATPEASTAMQLARNNQMMQNFLGGDAFAGFGLMQQNAMAFMQNPMGGPQGMGPVANHMAGMNRAAAISNELLYASHIGPNGMTGRTNKQFTQGYSQNELQQLAVELARGGAAAQLSDGSVVSMADGGTSAKDAAMMVSKYAKTARLMADTLGSRDMQEALADFKKLTGHSIATKGDPGIMRQEIANVAAMGESAGLQAREALGMFSHIRSGITADSRFNDVLYGRGAIAGGTAAQQALQSAMIRAERMGVLQSPEMMNELVKEQVSFEQTMLGTDGAKAAEMVTIMKQQGLVDDATMDRIKRATATGDRAELQSAIEDVSAAAFGGDTEALLEIAMDPTKRDKWLNINRNKLDGRQQLEAQQQAGALVQTGRRVRYQQETYSKRAERLSGTSADIAEEFGISLDDIDVDEATLTGMRDAGKKMSEALRKKGSGDVADALDSQMRDFERVMAREGYDAAVESLPEGSLLASVQGHVQSREELKVVQERTKGMLSTDLSKEVRDKLMTTEDGANFDKMSPEEKRQFARKKLQESLKLKGPENAEVRKEANKLAIKATSERSLRNKQIESSEDPRAALEEFIIRDSGTKVDAAGAELEEALRYQSSGQGGMEAEYKKQLDTATQAEIQKFIALKRDQEGWHVNSDGSVWRQAIGGEEADSDDGYVQVWTGDQMREKMRDRVKDRMVPPGLKLSGEVRVVKDSQGNDHAFDFKNVEVDEGGE